MKVYVANCTQQNQQINFRLPESRKPLSVMVPMGRQMLIGDLSPPEIDAMNEQLGPYGLRAADEIGGRKQKITYVYSTGKPVSATDIQRAHAQNRGMLNEEGRERRENAAIAANVAMNTDESPLNRLEMSVEEESSGSIPSEEPVAEGYRIDNTTDTNENKPKRAPRSGGRRG